MRKDYVMAVSKALKVAQYITHLNLQNTHLSTYGAVSIVESMNRATVSTLDFSYNPMIKVEFYKVLGNIINDSASKLLVLDLEANKMGDQITAVLCR